MSFYAKVMVIFKNTTLFHPTFDIVSPSWNETNNVLGELIHIQ